MSIITNGKQGVAIASKGTKTNIELAYLINVLFGTYLVIINK